jgi:hypothetical protein
MKRMLCIIPVVALSLALSVFSSSMASAQVFADDAYRAESAIISAGSRASVVSRIRAIPSIGVINLSFRNTARFRSDVPDVSEFKISAQKNRAGIFKLRSALQANPAIRAELARHGISIGRVVGVDVSSNGSLRLYII